MVAGANEDDRLRGQFVFNGAGQTGRYSSRGAQLHNLTRDRLELETECYDMVRAGCSAEELRAASTTGYLSEILSRLVRPAFITPVGRVFVWADWSSIEAMVLPWLAKDETTLDIFRAGEDVYLVNASKIFGRPITKDDKAERQAGKIAVLSLGFGGAVGAYRRMARGGGLRFSEAEAKRIVIGWRDANPWAQDFWGDLTWAFTQALQHPGTEFKAGRVAYMAVGAAMACFLPCGRVLWYPEVSYDTVIDEETGEEETNVLRFSARGKRKRIWHGLLAENCIAGDAEVLTPLGWRCLSAITDELVWDGLEFVNHEGLPL